MAHRGKHGTRIAEAKRRLRAHLRDRGLRSTRQREEVLRIFVEADAHLSVEELIERVRKADADIGFATVYRCMPLFVAAGVAKERRFHEGRVRYEPALRSAHHDHLICTACGDIQEFDDGRIEHLQEEIAAARGFTLTNHRMELYGLCASCRARRSG